MFLTQETRLTKMKKTEKKCPRKHRIECKWGRSISSWRGQCMIWTQLSFSFISSLFPLTCLSMAIWALVSSYRIHIGRNAFKPAVHIKQMIFPLLPPILLNCDVFYKITQQSIGTSGVGAVHPLMLPTASLLYSCHWPPVISWEQVRELHVCTTESPDTRLHPGTRQGNMPFVAYLSQQVSVKEDSLSS